MRKEWFDPKNIKEVLKAFTVARSHFANTLPLKERIYDADRILSKQIGPALPPSALRIVEKPDNTMTPLPPAKKRRTGLSAAELEQGAKAVKAIRKRMSVKSNDERRPVAERVHRT